MANDNDIITSAIDTAITAIVKRAPELHAAGITSITISDVSVTLMPPGPAAPPTDARGIDVTPSEPTADAPPPAPVDPLNDPASYNLGGRVPGFTRPPKR